jgi:hypothetical protein
MSGFANQTFAPLSGVDHVLQSIGVILTTRPGTRVERRAFGSDIPGLIDQPMNEQTILSMFVAAAEAIDRWEPRFRLTHVDVPKAGPDGALRLAIEGYYLPGGHLGDPRPVSAEVAL